jgi:predicted nucleic acid-binding protein
MDEGIKGWRNAMSWVVDTCLLIDVLEDDPDFGEQSAALIDRMSHEGLTICPVTYAELAPAFLGDNKRQCEFLDAIGIQYAVNWTHEDTKRAHKAWNTHIQHRRKGVPVKRPIADILIGAFAQGHQGLLTRNVHDFKHAFPTLTVKSP